MKEMGEIVKVMTLLKDMLDERVKDINTRQREVDNDRALVNNQLKYLDDIIKNHLPETIISLDQDEFR